MSYLYRTVLFYFSLMDGVCLVMLGAATRTRHFEIHFATNLIFFLDFCVQAYIYSSPTGTVTIHSAIFCVTYCYHSDYDISPDHVASTAGKLCYMMETRTLIRAFESSAIQSMLTKCFLQQDSTSLQ